ncbi:hypothetical protein MLD38_015702 [Melastoma candidum]|uniref:Uncharacterized protein n=1 Tax=Melastoma candidum TaxID=119954 RepID=A0ACB9RL65_9MYRT|nr:hypothetical protein MLD38_015702 [Melastoma candidum]
MTMIPPPPDHLLYACVATSTTILAQFSSDPGLIPLAHRCIHSPPPFHSLFSHTCGNTSLAFLIHPPFLYFAIFLPPLPKPHRLRFLHRLKASFLALSDDPGRLDQSLLQREFEPMIPRLVPPLGVPDADLDAGTRMLVVPSAGTSFEGLKKKKRGSGDYCWNNGEADRRKDGSFENRMEVRDVVCCSRDPGAGTVTKGPGDRMRAKQTWRRQLWVVLMLDVFFCLSLFVVWLWVCRGFQCIRG